MIQYVMILMMMTTLPFHKHGDDGHGNQCVPLREMRKDEGTVGFVAVLASCGGEYYYESTYE
jgi:hypothetical protein